MLYYLVYCVFRIPINNNILIFCNNITFLGGTLEQCIPKRQSQYSIYVTDTAKEKLLFLTNCCFSIFRIFITIFLVILLTFIVWSVNLCNLKFFFDEMLLDLVQCFHDNRYIIV